MSRKSIVIATRKSPLAVWQANHIKQRLEQLHPALTVELLAMSTKGDKILDAPLAKVGGKGLFVKELEVAMLEGHADIAVHSMKDVPVEFPSGLGLTVICEREAPTDAFVSNQYQGLDDLPVGAVVGSSSLRRQCQIKAMRPDLVVKNLRGNVNTRLQKLDQGEFDAIILATSGLKRLQLDARIRCELTPEQSLPAVGQGALGIESRLDDTELTELLAPLHHVETAACVLAERAMNATLQGGCQVPIASYAVLQQQQLWLRGLVGYPDGSTILRAETQGDMAQAEQLGELVAQQLLQQGAGDILKSLYE